LFRLAELPDERKRRARDRVQAGRRWPGRPGGWTSKCDQWRAECDEEIRQTKAFIARLMALGLL
jgi:hypothetical protein